jgi:hypothetical protein
MAKIILYKIQSGEELLNASIECKTQADYDANYPIAKKEAVGKITVEGEFEIEKPTQLDRIEAQTTYTAMMTDTLLEV